MSSRESLLLLGNILKQSANKPIATYEVSATVTYIIYGSISVNGVAGYPVFKVNEFVAGHTRFDDYFLTTAEDPKGGSATLLSELAALA
jgi:hypothetical protein